MVPPVSGLPASGASSFRVISATGLPCWSGSGIATSNSLDLQAGLPSSSVPFNGGTPESFSSVSKYVGLLASARAPLIFIQSASCGLVWSNSACFLAAIAAKKQAEFDQTNPQLALWMKIKGALADANNPTYFDTELKDSGVPPLKGTLLEGKPACKSKELLVAIPLPDQQGNPVAEITLKLDTPLAGKAGAGGSIEWRVVPRACTKDPFMLTMETEKVKVENLKTSPCAVAPAKKAVP